MMQRVNQQDGLSDQTAAQAYQIKRSADQEGEALATTKPNTKEELDSFKDKVVMIQRNEEFALRQTLGDRGFDHYKSLNPENGNGVQRPSENTRK
jgi:hypothetical protein